MALGGEQPDEEYYNLDPEVESAAMSAMVGLLVDAIEKHWNFENRNMVNATVGELKGIIFGINIANRKLGAGNIHIHAIALDENGDYVDRYLDHAAMAPLILPKGILQGIVDGLRKIQQAEITDKDIYIDERGVDGAPDRVDIEGNSFVSYEIYSYPVEKDGSQDTNRVISLYFEITDLLTVNRKGDIVPFEYEG